MPRVRKARSDNGGHMIESLRRHKWAIVVGVDVALLVVPMVMLALAGTRAPEQATATRGPIQEICQGPVDPNARAQMPALPVVVEIREGRDAAYLLAGPAPTGLTYVILCRTTDDDTFGGGGGGTVGPPTGALMSLDQGGGISSEYPDRLYGGRIGLSVTRVTATLSSGATVEATLADGWYLVWSRAPESAVGIAAYNAAGDEVRRLEDATGLRPPR